MFVIFLALFTYTNMATAEHQGLRERIEEAEKKIRHWFILRRIPGPRNGLIFLNPKPEIPQLPTEEFVLKEEPLVIKEELVNIPPSKFEKPRT